MTDLQRYVRQMQYPPIGAEGQRQLLAGRALVCGCGALGTVLAGTLARAGVGRLRLVDRDFLELNNLQRQILYDEADVASGLPKAILAQRRLQQINSQIEIEAHVCDVDATNVQSLVDGVDVILDGTDNFETRFLLNDVALERDIPWIYGGCIGSEGQSMTIVPGVTPCLRCLMADCPPPGTTPTCDTAGILAPIVQIVASWQAAEALKILCGHREAISRTLTVFDVWESRLRQIGLDQLRDGRSCAACDQRDFVWLRGERGSQSVVLCGRNAVQLRMPVSGPLDLSQLADRLASVGKVTRNAYLVRVELGDHRVTVFADGRAIVAGTDDPAVAKTLCARYIGL